MSNVRIGLLAGSAVALIALSGAGGFYAGHLSAKVQHLEAEQNAYAAFTGPGQLPYGAAPALTDPVSVASTPAPLQSSLTADGVPSAIAPVLADPKSAGGILNVLAKASAISTEGGITQKQPIYAFFDPTCPYCKNAMGELNGKAKINWIPVAAVSDMQTVANLIEGMKTLPADKAIASAAAGSIPQAKGSEETQGQLQNNFSILRAIYQGSEDRLAVPTFLVPRPDGTVMFYPGFDKADSAQGKPGDSAKLLEAYGS